MTWNSCQCTVAAICALLLIDYHFKTLIDFLDRLFAGQFNRRSSNCSIEIQQGNVQPNTAELLFTQKLVAARWCECKWNRLFNEKQKKQSLLVKGFYASQWCNCWLLMNLKSTSLQFLFNKHANQLLLGDPQKSFFNRKNWNRLPGLRSTCKGTVRSRKP